MAAPELSFHDALLQQSASCAHLGSPLYAEIFQAMATDLTDNGVTAHISEHLTIRPQRDAAPLRIAGAIHRLALTGKAPALPVTFRQLVEILGQRLLPITWKRSQYFVTILMTDSRAPFKQMKWVVPPCW